VVTGRPVLAAAAAGQSAYEGLIAASGERQGVFTWAVLDALRKGDRNGNGTIELSDLVAHVQSAVPAAAANVRGRGQAVISVPDQKQSTRFGPNGERISSWLAAFVSRRSFSGRTSVTGHVRACVLVPMVRTVRIQRKNGQVCVYWKSPLRSSVEQIQTGEVSSIDIVEHTDEEGEKTYSVQMGLKGGRRLYLASGLKQRPVVPAYQIRSALGLTGRND
jgi:hypothetical protein